MQFLGAFDELEPAPKLPVKGLRVILHDIKSAAFLRTLRAERADDHVTPWLYSRCDVRNVGSALLARGQEVKHRSIMPEIVGAVLKPCLSDICPQPPNGFRIPAQAFLGHIESRLRDIQNR